MPGLLRRLQAAEKAVLLNVQHAKLAQYHSVQLCHTARSPPSSSAAAADRAGPAANGLPQPEGAESFAEWQGGAQGSFEGSPRPDDHGKEEGAGGSGAATPPGSLSGRQQAAELQLLWAWRGKVTGGLPVSCLAWSKASPGLLAVGYGCLQYEVSGAGLVAVWSLANPTHPLWHTATPCGVSALDWSSKAPGTLALGFYDGSVAVYDVSSPSGSGKVGGSSEPLARAPPAGGGAGAGGGHAEPVWRLRYVPRPTDPGEEMLVSISSDGRVLEWKHAQGLERVELLRLKRPQRGGGASSARRTGGSGSGGPELPALQVGGADSPLLPQTPELPGTVLVISCLY